MALPHKPPNTQAGRHWKSGSHSSHMEFQDVVAIWRKQRTGTLVTSPEPELRTSCDISQWTDRYWIADGGQLPVAGPLCFHEFISSDFHQDALFIICSVHTDGAGESPHCANYSKVLILSMS